MYYKYINILCIYIYISISLKNTAKFRVMSQRDVCSHAVTTWLFVSQSEVFQMQNSWYSSPSKAVIKHVKKSRPGFY